MEWSLDTKCYIETLLRGCSLETISYGDMQHADGSIPGVGGKEEVRKMNKQFYCKQLFPSVLSSFASILHVL